MRPLSAVPMIAALAAACTTSPLENDRCAPFGDYGSFGCTIVEGRVTEADQSSAPGVDVTVNGPGVQSDVVQTDAAGDYQLWAVRVFRAPGDTSQTTAVWVRAAVPPPSGVSLRPRADSVAVTIRWSPNGSRPDTLAVPDIVLPPPT